MACWVEWWSPKASHVLIPGSCECYLISKERRVCKCNYVQNLEIRSSWITQMDSIVMTSVLISDRREEDTHTEEKAMWRQRQSMQWCCYKPGNTWGHQKLDKTRWDYFLEPSEGAWLCWHLNFVLTASELHENKFLFLATKFVVVC